MTESEKKYNRIMSLVKEHIVTYEEVEHELMSLLLLSKEEADHILRESESRNQEEGI